MSNLTSATFEYENIVIFATFYRSIHTYIATPICVVGVLVNILNVIVLSRKELRSATNFLLLYVAVCHIILNGVYIAHLSFQHFVVSDRCDPRRNTHLWLTITLAFAHISLSVHGLSTWLTVDLAGVRCLQLRTKDFCYSEPKIALKALVVTTICVMLVCTPSYLCFAVIPSLEPNELDCIYEPNVTHWRVGPSDFSEHLDSLPLNFVFWLASVTFFLLPALLLTVFITYLISTVTTFGNRRRKLGMGGIYQAQTTCWHIQMHTIMLLSILIIFVGTQLPQGILILLCSFLSENYRLDVYQNLGELLEVLTLINGSVSFPLYCSMSAQFRNTFKRLFWPTKRTARVVDNCPIPEELTNTYAYEQGIVLAAPCEKCHTGVRNSVIEGYPIMVNQYSSTLAYSSWLHRQLSLLESDEV